MKSMRARCRVATPWMRWITLGVFMLALAPARQEKSTVVLATSSSRHAWWVRDSGGAWLLEHVAQPNATQAPISPMSEFTHHVAARFADQPIALAAVDDRVWVFFAAVEGRCEVVSGRVDFNPASDLWFMVPEGMRLHSSVPLPIVSSAAAVGDSVWVIAQDQTQDQVQDQVQDQTQDQTQDPTRATSQAMRLINERWHKETLPAAIDPLRAHTLITCGDSLWCVQQTAGAAQRWRRDGDVWSELPLQVSAPMQWVAGSSRLAAVAGDPPQVGRVQVGTFVAQALVPADCAVLAWGDGFAALRLQGESVQWAQLDAGQSAFSDFITLPTQKSRASRWFHLPILATLSLGSFMLAFLVRSTLAATPLAKVIAITPMLKIKRLAALAIDAAPMGLASMLALQADFDTLLTPPLWSTDINNALPYMCMVAATIFFGTLEECVGSRSLGKRVMGGVIVGQHGEQVAWWRHVIRNIFKGIVLLSPLIVLPTVLSPRGQGVPEVITRTLVAAK